MSKSEPVADALVELAVAIKYLGNGNAATEMGALEALGAVLKERSVIEASVLGELGDSIERAAETIAAALDRLADAAKKEAG